MALWHLGTFGFWRHYYHHSHNPHYQYDMLLLLLISLSLALLFTSIDALQDHRVFPAASFERYAADDPVLLRTVDPNDFDMFYNTAPNNKAMDTFLQAAKERFLKTLFVLPDYPEMFSPQQNKTLLPLKRLVLTITSNSTDLHPHVDESYSLRIENMTTQNALLNATTVYGILRGLETFSQLLSFAWMQQNKHAMYSLPTTFWIADAPEYSYRGLLIDTARHYLPISLILANLDAMAMNKLNVLHWHMTDSQSFPYQSLQFPELAEKGAFHPKRIYTPQTIQLIVQQAMLRGIRVIPEFDLPGHCQAIAASHPEYMSYCPKPSEPLDPTQPAVYEFLEKLYSEITHVFPDEYIHVGGDEVSLECWKNSSTIQTWMKQRGIHNETLLYAHFENQVQSLLRNKTIIVWQEAYTLGVLPKDTVIIDVWKSHDNCTLQQATLQGYRVLVSSCWYLDDLNKDWKDFYQCLPRNFTGTTLEKSRVVGGHASMWGEQVDATNFFPRVWPRASAAAERLWTGSLKTAEASVKERLVKFRCHLVARGIAAEPVGPGSSCPREAEYVHEKKQYGVVHNVKSVNMYYE